MTYSSRQQYLEALEKRAVLPQGFRCATTALKFEPVEKPGAASMNLSLIQLEEETSHFAGVFTRNRYPGAPVTICRRRMAQDSVSGILINNKIANVAAPSGVQDAESLLSALGSLIETPGTQYLPASTGVVGWSLPLSAMKQALPSLIAGPGGSAVAVAEAIMTTDSYPKLRSSVLGQGRILGLAKGAGMIEPNMATMLVFILTDLDIDRSALQRTLSFCSERSFNCISVDGDQSTSDMALLLSSAKIPGVTQEEFQTALLALCRGLAEDIVRNGEGVGHVIKVTVRGADRKTALGAGKAVINSPLVKTAIFGNDPNVGRLISALGDYLGNTGSTVDPQVVSVQMGSVPLFAAGCFSLNRLKEQQLSQYLKGCSLDPELKGYPQHDRVVEIDFDLGGPEEAVEVLGSDLSYAYIKENAEYRS
jgi:glutamate N-acetyltransferase/amino-acid N-acetyltransferase